ncbi:unknown [Clostridium sp. CAG:813]|nr:unknown [Clostridium sp. CAG:813]
MVDKLQVDNPANKQMHYGQTSVGILTPPNRLPKVLVYSGIEAQKRYDDMQHDLYVS